MEKVLDSKDLASGVIAVLIDRPNGGIHRLLVAVDIIRRRGAARAAAPGSGIVVCVLLLGVKAH